MKVRFWGVRGSIPVPGKQTNRYGGNTSCVAVYPRDGDPIVIDAGTGIRLLGKELMTRSFGEGGGTAHLLISHTHWDHIQGLPFFSPLYQRGNDIKLYARQRDDTHLRAVFASQTENLYFPVPMASLQANIEFRELMEGQEFRIGNATVRCTRLNHPWIAMAYRIDADGASVVYASDTAPFTDILFGHEFIPTAPDLGAAMPPQDRAILQAMRAELVDLCRGADFLIYDTQFTIEEYRAHPHWGHSTPDDAIAIAREAGVKTLCLYHHAPARDDDAQDRILEQYRAECAAAGETFEIVAAYEGLEVGLGEQE